MTELRELALGDAAREYMRQQLRDGHLIAQAVLRSVDLNRGSIITILPKGTSLEDANKFATGGKLPEPPPAQWSCGPGVVMKPVPDTSEFLSAKIETFVNSSFLNVCIVEDLLSAPTDGWIKRKRSKVIFSDGQVFHWLTQRGGSGNARDMAQAALWHPPHTGILGRAAPFSAFLRGDQLVPAAELTDIANNASCIFVGAYDGESYVIWRR
jgi:hypothetical protein